MSKSESTRFREKGNDLYCSANIEGISPCIKICRLNNAINYYNQAKSSSCNQEERVSACKNIGIASKLISMELRKNKDTEKESEYHSKEALLSFDIAHRFSMCKSNDWREKLLSKYFETVDDLIEYYTAPNAFSFNDMIGVLENFAQSIEYNHHLRCEFLIKISHLRFQEGVTQLSFKNYKQSLYQMVECYKPVEEARRYGKDLQHVMIEVRVLQQDVYVHECIARSHQVRNEGDQLLEKYIKSDEVLNMGMVWTVVDMYKEAIILTRETDMEAEAIALSRLGSVFHKVVKDKTRAKPYFMRSIQLAMSLHPRTFDSEGWFRESQATLEKYQAEMIKQEDDIWRKEREPYLKELKKELDDIKEKNAKGKKALLTFLYANYPPKWKFEKLEELPEDSEYQKWKPIFKKAVVHYHPDKVDTKKDGQKWKVLCEEISKIVTARYETLK